MMLNRFFDIAIPPEWAERIENTVEQTEDTVPQTGEVATTLGGVDMQTLLLLMVILILVAVGIVYFGMLRKNKLALQIEGEIPEAKEE